MRPTETREVLIYLTQISLSLWLLSERKPNRKRKEQQLFKLVAGSKGEKNIHKQMFRFIFKLWGLLFSQHFTTILSKITVFVT